MSEPRLVSPLLDGFVLGDAISDHHGVRCCPAIRENTDERYIVKIISIPATQVQLDALLLTGACSDQEQALAYFKELSDGVIGEADILEKLSKLEGFVPYLGHQVCQMEDGVGYEVYLNSKYKRSLGKLMITQPLTHLAAVNLGLDLCAALAACRRSGYLYVDLKPENIFLSETQGYRIGDLGFISLSSLKYASLPEKYRSRYTPPEISDALSSLNDTMDIYALGLILYQIYNNGQLPFEGSAPASAFPAPMYADYEMAEIILKACDPDPRNRWQDPALMGQSLVNYMQRNSVNDTPIIPPPVIIEESQEDTEQFLSEEENAEELAELLAMIPDEVPPQQLTMDCVDIPEVEPNTEEATDDEPEKEETSYEDETQLSFLEGLTDDETVPSEETSTDLQEAEVTDEVAQILAQADDLIAHELPEPVVAPAPIDVPIPAPIIVEPEIEEEPEDAAEEIDLPVSEDIEEDTQDTEAEPEEMEDDISFEQPTERLPRRWLSAAIAALLLIIAGIGVSVWYNQFYLQTVEAFVVHYDPGQIHVQITSDIDDDLLTVVCTDTYGNAKRCPVTNGAAVFGDLNPATQYRIRLEISGFHKLVGPTTGSYTTDGETEILDFNAVSGPEDGSVALRFTVNGPDSEQWTIAYSTPGEPEKTQIMTGHNITIYDLTPGSAYTFRLLTPAGRYLVGTTEITYTVQNILVAQDLKITACGSSALTVQWQAPDAPAGQKWLVRCYNDAGYDKTVTTTDTSCVFTDLDHATSYTILVTAEGKTQSADITVPADPLNVTGYTTTVTAPWAMTLSWEYTGTAPANGWILHYSVDGGEQINVTCPENQAEIALAPGCSYVFTVSAADETLCFSDAFTYGPVDVPAFEGYGVTAGDMTLSTVLRPDKANWGVVDLTDEDYKSNFAASESVSILAHLSKTYTVSDQTITTTYVVRGSDNRMVSLDTQDRTWRNMWYQRYCELDLPQMPTAPDTYTVDIYFNDLYVGSVQFTVS